MSQLEPVYVPTLNHEEDMAHFDEEFLQMTPRLSYQTASGCLQNDENLWQGFSFVCNTFNADNANATSSCIQNKREKAKVMEQWNEELPLLNVSVETLSVARESLEEAFGLEL